MDLLISAQRVRHRGAVTCERRRIEDDQVKTRHHSFMRLHRRVRLEPVKDVNGFKRAAVGQAIGGGVALRGGNGIRALVEQMYMRGPGARGVQAESAEKTETIQHLTAFGELRHSL